MSAYLAAGQPAMATTRSTATAILIIILSVTCYWVMLDLAKPVVYLLFYWDKIWWRDVPLRWICSVASGEWKMWEVLLENCTTQAARQTDWLDLPKRSCWVEWPLRELLITVLLNAGLYPACACSACGCCHWNPHLLVSTKHHTVHTEVSRLSRPVLYTSWNKSLKHGGAR